MLDVHWLVIIQMYPALYDAIQDPECCERDQKITNNNYNSQRSKRIPQHAVPERAYLPSEVGFQPGSPNIIDLDIIYDYGSDIADASNISQGLQDIDYLGQ